MTAIDILKNLKSAGYVVGFDDHDILIDLPGGGEVDLDSGLKEEVIEHKQEILFHLRNREYDRLRAQASKLAEYLNSPAAPLPARKEKVPEYESLIDEIGDLQFWVDYYQSSGLDRWYCEGWLLLYSDLLNEIVCIVRGPEIKLPPGCEAYPIYEFKEVEALSGKSDQTIRGVHAVKKNFKGQVVKGAKK